MPQSIPTHNGQTSYCKSTPDKLSPQQVSVRAKHNNMKSVQQYIFAKSKHKD